MNYKDVLEEQKEKLDKRHEWWPSFFYHFTDVHNAASILNDGYIYSRAQAIETNSMTVDNASTIVIDATSDESKGYGRLYFRPKTPTQYNNEGYKPVSVRNSEINANCPVPVFLCLDSTKILELEGTLFAEKGIAGYRHDIKSGVGDFSKLNFDKIYHDGHYDKEKDADIKEYRHSEIIRIGGFPVEPYLRCILCRTQAEQDTLLFLLKKYSLRLFNSYEKKVLYKPDLECFYNNGIFIRTVYYNIDEIEFELNDPEERKKTGAEVFFKAQIFIQMKKETGEIINEHRYSSDLNYNLVRVFKIKLSRKKKYEVLRVKVQFDKSIMYENEISVRDMAIV